MDASLVQELLAFVPVQLTLLGSMQAPYKQLVLPEQAVPHAPQFLASAVRSTHLPLHAVWPVGHAQTPAVHAPPVGQVVPHAPQFVVLARMSTQALFVPQAPSPVGQRQAPIQQLWSTGHALPHVPQLAWLPVRSTQALPHLVKPVAQPEPHLPALQAWPAAQAVPHAPQFAASVLKLRQSLSHRVPMQVELALALPPLVALTPPEGAPALVVVKEPPAPARADEVAPPLELLALALALPFAPAALSRCDGPAELAHPSAIKPAPRTIDRQLRSRVQLSIVDWALLGAAANSVCLLI
jgi:hypothetical protein